MASTWPELHAGTNFNYVWSTALLEWVKETQPSGGGGGGTTTVDGTVSVLPVARTVTTNTFTSSNTTYTSPSLTGIASVTMTIVSTSTVSGQLAFFGGSEGTALFGKYESPTSLIGIGLGIVATLYDFYLVAGVSVTFDVTGYSTFSIVPTLIAGAETIVVSIVYSPTSVTVPVPLMSAGGVQLQSGYGLTSGDEGALFVRPITQDYALQFDGSTSPIVYLGQAVPGSSTAAAVWSICKIDTSVSASAAITWAGGSASHSNVWDSRILYTYS